MSGDVAPLGPLPRVVTALKLTASARERLAEVVGPHLDLVDIREADGTEDVVVTPPVSRQLVGRLREAFPNATVMVMEISDPQHRMDFEGPVRRALDAGAHGYYVASSIEQMAVFLERAATRDGEPPDHQPAALEPPEDELSEVVQAILEQGRRARGRRPGPAGET